MGLDQDDTAARVTHHHAGVRLSRTASIASIRQAATQVLDHDDYRRASRGLAMAIQAEQDPTTLVREAESLAATGDDPSQPQRHSAE